MKKTRPQPPKNIEKLIKFVSENYPSLLKEVEKKLIKK